MDIIESLIDLAVEVIDVTTQSKAKKQRDADKKKNDESSDIIGSEE